MMKRISYRRYMDLGMNEASKLLNKRLSRGRLVDSRWQGILSSITPSLHYAEC